MFDFKKLFRRRALQSQSLSASTDSLSRVSRRHSPLNTSFTNPYFNRGLLDTRRMKKTKKKFKEIPVNFYRNSIDSSDFSDNNWDASRVTSPDDNSFQSLEAAKEILSRLRLDGLARSSELTVRELWQLRDSVLTGGRPSLGQRCRDRYRTLRSMPVELKTKLLIVYCPHDRPIGRTLASHFALVFPFVHVYESVDFMFGINTCDFWERVVETTPYIFVLISKAFLKFALDDLGLKLAFRDIELMDLEYDSVLLPIYLEEIAPEETESLFDATNRMGVQAFGPHLSYGLRCLHRALQMNLEQDIEQKYNEVLNVTKKT
ncbi:hypothetical protein FHG87_016945 [Trinorchestia longiramus]|nr:hypothetical protein FHG87_016945 [Trinorchestia longiramus]